MVSGVLVDILLRGRLAGDALGEGFVPFHIFFAVGEEEAEAKHAFLVSDDDWSTRCNSARGSCCMS